MIKFTENFQSIIKDDVIEFEKNNNIKLPKEYKNFLLNSNGGYSPHPNCFNFFNGEDGSVIQYFYGINLPEKNRESYTSLEQAALASGEDFPSKYLAIGDDSFGNKILLNIENGQICFCDYEIMFDEEEGEDVETFEDNIRLISNSFQEFLDGLYEYTLDDE